MDVPQLPELRGLLVTADNPPRADLSGMDYARCAALHNYLVHYAWTAEGRAPVSLCRNISTFFTTHGAVAEALRPRLDPSLAAFLATALVPPDALDPPPLFFWAWGFSSPRNFFADHAIDLFDQPEDSLVCLYSPNVGQGGEADSALLYHQRYHLAAVFMHTDDYDYALPVEAHGMLWNPLETVLSNWIELIHLGKITASLRDTPPLFGGEKIGPWEWHSYSEAQVSSCLDAWDRLCDTIEAQIKLLSPSPTGTAVTTVGPQFLLTCAALDRASVPSPCFVRSFLTRARRPRFRYIAPGLLLPPIDAQEFAATQPFTTLPRASYTIPPVYMFPAVAGGRDVDLTQPSNPFYIRFRAKSAKSEKSTVPSRIPAGVYSEPVERNVLDNTEEGFRLLLPYGLDGDVGNESVGARKSDGSFVEKGAVAELFQHGYKPFGGDYYRPQRLERLFEHWCKLVNEGVWPVGPQGVEGNIDTFREADTTRWGNYVISPTW
ncbi:hypothetical protein GQX73_g895 [Xylaria multiplex]|uniref:Uncharacterized protein n=1 Tax=Xylaria multiplex TaxID=323545 RepID=A0A7C8IWX0_9PEZI|nr:hypothetical protein GQX73_g895 [Xylaria multiplex]